MVKIHRCSGIIIWLIKTLFKSIDSGINQTFSEQPYIYIYIYIYIHTQKKTPHYSINFATHMELTFRHIPQKGYCERKKKN